jgi:UDP-N-acetylmuramoylalanine--D-glutamate ligase
MTTARDFTVRDKRVTVAGAARSGIAAAELLIRRGATVVLSESKPDFPEAERLRAAGVELEIGGHRETTFTGADLIVTSPGVPLSLPVIEAARTQGIPVIGELELASRWLRGRVVAITGTKGKSTTTTLTGRMLEAGGHRVLVGGNIGHALSAQVDESTEDTIHVIEVSSFQLEATETFRPSIAVLLNFSPDHLDRHASVAALLNMSSAGRAARLLFSMRASLAEGVVLEGDEIVRRSPAGDEPLVPLSSVRLLGRHLVEDVLAAAAVASLVGVDAEAITRAVEGFGGLEHALELVTDIGGVRFVNDSKATNIEAAKRAVEAFEDHVVLIAGGRFKGGDFRDLRTPLIARHATIVAIGEARPLIRDALGAEMPIQEAADMSAAVRTAFASAEPGGTVVLAPGCASFDMFRDYAERGRAFRQEVLRLRDEWNSAREQ